jgi:hypothetical protein
MNWNIKNDKIRELVSTFSPEIKNAIIYRPEAFFRYVINGKNLYYDLGARKWIAENSRYEWIEA